MEAFARTTEDRRSLRATLGIPEDSVAVGIIGRIAPEKGHAVLLAAFEKVQARYPLRLVIVGNGPDEALIRSRAAALGLADKVIFTGFRDDVNNVINALDVVAVPSTWNEPCSAVVQQGMAVSKPVIGTRAGGTPENGAGRRDRLSRAAGGRRRFGRRTGPIGRGCVPAEASRRSGPGARRGAVLPARDDRQNRGFVPARIRDRLRRGGAAKGDRLVTSARSSVSTRPLTIVQVASNLDSWGGLEIHLLQLGVQLRDRGHRVIIAGRPGRFVLARAEALGLETFEATVRRQSDWTDFGHYREFFRREKVDVIHAHNQEDALVPAAAARLAGVPASFLTWHLPFPFRKRTRGRLILALLHRRLIAISNSVREMHLQHGVDAKKMEVIHHGTDVEAFQRLTGDVPALRGSLGLMPKDIAIGIIGRVAPEKGHRDLFEALRLLEKSRLRIVVVGDGPDLEKLKREAAENGLSSRVIFTGFRNDVNNVIAAVDIVAVPSVWPEPCSAVVQQGMALGKPVVGTRTGGTPEMIVDGETGLLVPVGDVSALAAVLTCLSETPELRKKMGTAGRRRVEAHFTLRGMTDKVEALYRRELEQAAK